MRCNLQRSSRRARARAAPRPRPGSARRTSWPSAASSSWCATTSTRSTTTRCCRRVRYRPTSYVYKSIPLLVCNLFYEGLLVPSFRGANLEDGQGPGGGGHIGGEARRHPPWDWQVPREHEGNCIPPSPPPPSAPLPLSRYLLFNAARRPLHTAGRAALMYDCAVTRFTLLINE